jgi:hypothetical protein
MTDPTDQRLDQRLAAAGRRWRAEVSPPPTVPVERLGEAAPRPVDRRSVLALGVAATVVLAAGVGIGVLRAAGGDSSHPSDHPSPTATVHGTRMPQEIVPWRKLTAQHSQLGHRVNGKLVTPYDGVVATGHIGGVLHPGDTLRFTVTLESSARIVLHPCPDYSIAFGRKGFLSGQLNCSQVPYYASVVGPHGHMSDFRPTLPANTPVSFQMRMTVPEERGRQKVLWTLDGPESSPGFYGIVRVTPRD